MAQHPKTRKIVAQASILAVLCLCAMTPPAQARSGVVFGCAADRLTDFTRLGMIETLSPTFSLFIPVDLGDNQETAAALPLMTVYIDHTFTLGLMLGPEVTIKTDSITTADKITYLQAATGALAAWNLADDLSLWAVAQFRAGDLNAPVLKIGFGLVAWID